MGDPLKPIPQTREGDNRSIAEALKAIKYILDVREGRSTSDKGARWVTFDDLEAALKNVPTQTIDVKAALKEALLEPLSSEAIPENSVLGILVKISGCACPETPPAS